VKLLLALLCSSLISVAAPAWADSLPPEAWDCIDKHVGDACTVTAGTNEAGKCTNDTCTSAKPDGSSSSYPCTKCLPGSSSDDGGCAVAKHGAARRIGPWFLAGLSALLFLFKRRRAG
jgi:hypothetical protein